MSKSWPMATGLVPRTSIGLNGGEGCGITRRLDVVEGLASRQVCNLRGGLRRDRNDFRAVDEKAGVLTDNRHLSHGGGELGDHGALVGCEMVGGQQTGATLLQRLDTH